LIARAREDFGMRVSTLINNALPNFSFNGDARPRVEELTLAHLHQQFDGVVGGALNTVQTALVGMRESGFGRIVNIGTNLFQNPVVPYHDYTAGKADRKSTRLNSSHVAISYAVFCLQKKKKI